ncbi:hypothetical protein P175DRAFT_0171258 [Aspergillus ochraceoroseus IBT 24754]|uniref:Uncharacterized protein n=1 Tax=Aspergillus ochraceoroseus IBT 24754 TaxID=1392256 RepID=A0A2T5M4F4_9EURO|nr:uncharacterized protein P175DRAFT_0171258 [Aspergillus ochraceoroseus IBT 24754]PTU23417.1 hypothetical protein P175DRAFT_0171258 [Aspergillus ochraceoroseus IBT 24754]
MHCEATWGNSARTVTQVDFRHSMGLSDIRIVQHHSRLPDNVRKRISISNHEPKHQPYPSLVTYGPTWSNFIINDRNSIQEIVEKQAPPPRGSPTRNPLSNHVYKFACPERGKTRTEFTTFIGELVN